MTGTKLSKSEKIWQSIFSNNSENEEFSKNYSETQTDKNWLIPKEPNTVCFWRELYPNKQEIWIDHSYLWTACYSQEEWTEFRNVKFHELVQRFESRGQAFKKIVSDTDKKIEYECDLDNNVKCHLCLFDCLSKNYRGIGIELCNCDFKDERKIKSISGWVAFFTLTLRDIIEELDINNQVYQQLESINISQTSDDNKDEENCNNDSATDKNYIHTILNFKVLVVNLYQVQLMMKPGITLKKNLTVMLKHTVKLLIMKKYLKIFVYVMIQMNYMKMMIQVIIIVGLVMKISL